MVLQSWPCDVASVSPSSRLGSKCSARHLLHPSPETEVFVFDPLPCFPFLPAAFREPGLGCQLCCQSPLSASLDSHTLRREKKPGCRYFIFSLIPGTKRASTRLNSSVAAIFCGRSQTAAKNFFQSLC